MSRFESNPTPSVLIWARQRAGFNLESAAQKIRVSPEQLAAWEEGSDKPSISQLRRIAQLYKRPLAAFYLSKPPTRFEVMHDFRKLAETNADTPISPRLAQEIRSAYDRREWALELMEALDEEVPKFTLRLSIQTNEEVAAASVRSALEITVQRQALWRDEYQALREWRLLVERAGILTFQTSRLPLEEARGFSISLNPLPVAVMNNKDAPRGRIFTLLHEVAHLLLNDGGICDMHDSNIEAYCNRVASAAIFPRDELLSCGLLREHRNGATWTDDELAAISRQFGGSREAALVRLLNLGLTTEKFYRSRHQEYLDAYKLRAERQSSGFAPPHEVNLASAGPLFTRLVVDSLAQQKITTSDATDFLQIRTKHLDAARELAAQTP
jgi:Zn-dependent peptidase ImmA (M78 family)/DNA-binding XRE family transcriptional regulator